MQAGPAPQQVAGEGEDVVGFTKKEANGEQVQAFVDGVDETALPCQGVRSANFTGGETTSAVGNLLACC